MFSLLFHSKKREMFITSQGLTDPYFRDGWRNGSTEKSIPDAILNEFEFRGYTLIDEPEKDSLPQVRHSSKRHTTLFDTATEYKPVIY